MDFLEPTQRLDSTDSEVGLDNASATEETICGYLSVQNNDSEKEQKFKVLKGDNLVGRDPSQCSIVLSSGSLSRVHAVIDGQKGGCAIMDKNSSNGCFKGTLKLKPNIFYALESGDIVKLGNVSLKFCQDDEKENSSHNFLIPETPTTCKKAMRNPNDQSWLAPNSHSSPMVSLARTVLPESPCQETSLNNSSSFLAPSQPLAQGNETRKTKESMMLTCETQPLGDLVAETPSSSILNMETQPLRNSDGVGTSSLFDMETQKIHSSEENEKVGTSSLFDMETQKMNSFEATEKVGTSSLLDMETQKIDSSEANEKAAKDETKGSQKMEIDESLKQTPAISDSIFDQPTQATDLDQQSNASSEDLLEGQDTDEDMFMGSEDILAQDTEKIQPEKEENKNETNDEVFEGSTQIMDEDEIKESDDNDAKDDAASESDDSSLDLIPSSQEEVPSSARLFMKPPSLSTVQESSESSTANSYRQSVRICKPCPETEYDTGGISTPEDLITESQPVFQNIAREGPILSQDSAGLLGSTQTLIEPYDEFEDSDQDETEQLPASPLPETEPMHLQQEEIEQDELSEHADEEEEDEMPFDLDDNPAENAAMTKHQSPEKQSMPSPKDNDKTTLTDKSIAEESLHEPQRAVDSDNPTEPLDNGPKNTFPKRSSGRGTKSFFRDLPKITKPLRRNAEDDDKESSPPRKSSGRSENDVKSDLPEKSPPFAQNNGAIKSTTEPVRRSSRTKRPSKRMLESEKDSTDNKEGSNSEEQVLSAKKPRRSSKANSAPALVTESNTPQETEVGTRRSRRVSGKPVKTEDVVTNVAARRSSRRTTKVNPLPEVTEDQPSDAQVESTRPSRQVKQEPVESELIARTRRSKAIKLDNETAQEEQPKRARGRRQTTVQIKQEVIEEVVPEKRARRSRKTAIEIKTEAPESDNNLEGQTLPASKGAARRRNAQKSPQPCCSKSLSPRVELTKLHIPQNITSKASKSSTEPAAKRASSSRNSLTSDDSRKKSKPKVMLTGYESPHNIKLVKELGGGLATNVNDCTVLIAEKIKRTTKLLCALGRGIPIVSPNWLSQSKMTKTFLGESQLLFVLYL